MLWKNQEPDIKILKDYEIINDIGFKAGVHSLQSNDKVTLVITKNCWKQMMNHIEPHKVEMGGLVVGKVYKRKTPDEFICLFLKAIPAIDKDSSPVSLLMGTEVWNHANKNSLENEVVVGWFHSHPNLGAFFSGTDRMNQQANFSSQFHIGIVIDHIRDEYAVFYGKDSIQIDNKNVIVIEE